MFGMKGVRATWLGVALLAGAALLLAPAGAAAVPTVPELRQALVSIYQVAAGRTADPHVFLPLHKAVEILLEDQGTTPLARSRRIRAAIRLAGGSHFRTQPTVEIEPASFDTAIKELVGASQAEEIARRVVQRGAQTPEARRAVAFEVLGTGFPSCDVSPSPSSAVTTDPVTHETTAVTQFTIGKSVGDVAAVLDPRGWPTCSDFFPPGQTYVAAKKSNGDVVGVVDCKLAKQADQPPIGQTWTDYVFERFELGLGTLTFFNNELLVDSKRSSDSYEMNYLLADSICSMVDFYETTRKEGGVDLDWGGASAEKDETGRTAVHAVKRLRLSPRPFTVPLQDLREWTVTALEGMSDEVVASVCCAGGP